MPPRTPGPFANNSSCLPTATATATALYTPSTTTTGNISAPALSMPHPSPPPPLTALQTHTPPSNSDPDLDLDPSPVYSPLSTPAQTPKPPPSPPMAPVDAPRPPPQPTSQVSSIVHDVKPSQLETSSIKSTPVQNTSLSATTPPSSTTTTPTHPSSSTTNTDSIALRSTLRLLMLQRERAKKDIQTLEELRIQAMERPVEFIDYIQQLARGSSSNDHVTASGSSDEEGTSTSTKKKKNYAPFSATKELPKPQEIFRCPQIEWQKYHVLGAPLDKLVEEQQRRPQVVPQQMQTGGVLGVGVEFGDKISGDGGGIQGRMRLFDGVAQRGGVVGR